MKGSLSELETDLINLWKNYRVEPTYMQMELGQFRKNCRKHGALPHARKFLRETRKVSGRAIVVLTPGKCALLTDDKGRLLEFK